MAEINTQTINSDELPEDASERGLLESRDALEHTIAWKTHVTQAKVHLDALLNSAKASRNIPEVYEKLNDELKEKMANSVLYMTKFSEELRRQIKDADQAYDGIYKELQERAAMIAFNLLTNPQPPEQGDQE